MFRFNFKLTKHSHFTNKIFPGEERESEGSESVALKSLWVHWPTTDGLLSTKGISKEQWKTFLKDTNYFARTEKDKKRTQIITERSRIYSTKEERRGK